MTIKYHSGKLLGKISSRKKRLRFDLGEKIESITFHNCLHEMEQRCKTVQFKIHRRGLSTVQGLSE